MGTTAVCLDFVFRISRCTRFAVLKRYNYCGPSFRITMIFLSHCASGELRQLHDMIPRLITYPFCDVESVEPICDAMLNFEYRCAPTLRFRRGATLARSDFAYKLDTHFSISEGTTNVRGTIEFQVSLGYSNYMMLSRVSLCIHFASLEGCSKYAMSC